jgi:Xaa-Pro dipeptidase
VGSKNPSAGVHTGSITGTGIPFPALEYKRRLDAIVAQFDSYGIDALAATALPSQEYLTGYDGSGAYFAPFPVIVRPGREPTYVVRRYDEDAVRALSWLEDVRSYEQEGEFPRVWARALRECGLERARLGLELRSWNLTPWDVAELRLELPGLTIVDVTRLIPTVAARKSALEIEAMRESMALTDLAAEAFYSSIREGATERAVTAAMARAVDGADGQMHVYSVLFGQRTALPHGTPSANPIGRDQVAFMEMAGVRHGYAAGLCRSAVLGRHPAAEDLHSIAEEALTAAIESIRPGATAGSIDTAARNALAAAGRSRTFRHRTGYQNGIAWSYRGNMSLEPDAQDVIEPGMTFHLPIILFDEGRFGVGTSETVLVGPSNAEVLSRVTRKLRVI